MSRASLDPQQQRGRALNAVAQLLSRELIVPKIFFEARWPDRNYLVDVLAVDRSGAGDIHVAMVRVGKWKLDDFFPELLVCPAHYKYIALAENADCWPNEEELYAPDGIGRIGLVQVVDEGDSLAASVHLRPERFRLTSDYFKKIDQFTAKHPADIEVRP